MKTKNKKQKSVLFRFLPYMFSKFKLECILVIFFIMVYCAVTIFSSYFINILINDYIVPYQQKPWLTAEFDHKLMILLIVVSSIYFVGALSTLIYSKLMVRVTQGTLQSMRNDLFVHMEKLPISFFDWNTHGNLMSYYTNDVEALRLMISQSLPQIMMTFLICVPVYVIMILYSWFLTLVFTVIFITMLIITKTCGGRSTKYFISKQQSLGKVTGYVEEMIEGQKVIKVFCHEKEAIEGFSKLNNELEKVDCKANVFASILMPIMNNIGYITYAVITFIGGLIIAETAKEHSEFISIISKGFIDKSLDAGVLVSFILFTRQVVNMIGLTNQQMNSIAMGLAGSRRLFDLFDKKHEIDEGYVTLIHGVKQGDDYVESDDKDAIWVWRHPHHDGTVTYTPLQGDVRFYDVDFGYKSDKIVLHGVNLFAKPGQKIAFVGATGAGKTTITNLINRFYDIADGKIKYDGININKIKKQDLRRSLGIVLQDTHLFTGTIAENIAYGKPNATREEIINAAKLANADVFISHLAKGYDTVITNNGEGLSQGERQLLSIARAAITNPPVLILDEATSSIDTRTEKIIQEAMDKLMNGRTVFVIAHRLSTIRNSDAIMVLNQGKIIERGNHEELLVQKGEYYQLYTGAIEMD